MSVHESKDWLGMFRVGRMMDERSRFYGVGKKFWRESGSELLPSEVDSTALSLTNARYRLVG